MWMLPLYLHVNQKSDYDDDDIPLSFIMFFFSFFKNDCLIFCNVELGLE